MTMHPRHQEFTLGYNRELKDSNRHPAPTLELTVNSHTCHIPVRISIVAASKMAASDPPQLNPSLHEVTIHVVCDDDEIELAERLIQAHQDTVRESLYRTTTPDLVHLIVQLDSLCNALRTIIFVHAGDAVKEHLGETAAHAPMTQLGPLISQAVTSYDI